MTDEGMTDTGVCDGAEYGQTVVVVKTSEVTTPTGQFVTVGAQLVIV
jgi:hypothetical protein